MGKFDNNKNLIPLIKKLDYKKLQVLADSLRDELIEDVSLTGGHLASNLGVVELTIALHKVFDSPKDKIVWDVGHQCYVHKLITGRRDELKNQRNIGGISGFPKRNESIHDTYDSGHSSTSVSAALGYAKARDLKHENYSCIAVIGDGALTGGVAFEALNHAGSTQTPIIVILNDNQMSISGSVGGMSKYLQHIRTSKLYQSFKSGIKSSTSDTPMIYKGLENIRDALKNLFVPGQMFEEMGFKYYGPIDGHNIAELCNSLEFAKNANRPILLHIVTKKGKGFKPAEENPSKFHGIGKFDIKSIDSKDVDTTGTWSDIFGDEITELAKHDDRIVAISAAMIDGTGLKKMKEKIPSRVVDVGIAEQHAVSYAAGLALNGMKPVVALYSTFLQRAYDEVLIDVCLQNLPVVFVIDRAGVSGQDGETHQGNFDISFLSSMPNMTILSPDDENSLRAMLQYALRLNSPCAIRYPKGKAPKYDLAENYIPGPKMIHRGEDAVILCDGSFESAAMHCAENSEKSIAVINMEILKPISSDLIQSIKRFKHIITIEDGCTIGGFGSYISSEIAKDGNNKVLNIGWPDKFIEHGSIEELRKKYLLDDNSILEKVENFIEN